MTRQRANGEGTVYARKNKQDKVIGYRGSYFAPDGKRRHVSGKTKTEALVALRKAIVDRDGGLIFEVENITLAEYLHRWLNGPIRTKNLKPITVEQYEQQIRVHIVPSLGRVKLRKLSPELVQDFYDSKVAAGLKPASVRYIHAVLHNALEHAHKRRLIPENVASKTDPPKVRPPEIQPLDAEQVKTLLDAARTEPLGGLYVVAATAGLRIGELLALKWTDVDLEHRKMRVSRTLSRAKGGPRFTTPKNGKGRPVTLTTQAVEALRSHRKGQNEARLRLGTLWEDNGLIFASETGKPLTRDFVDRRSFKPLLKRAGLPKIKLHDLRHTCATLLLSRGVHPKYVQELLGHASIVMTLNRYSHWIPSMGDQTARAMEAALS
ncbi:MAG: Integrase [uncultured Chloroflexia bacterium]|uniref:Integrase n=1 Tax=uncultured Chloroflexia bacterium TaxID=1672391 RepID=A0A6J4JBV9_9CHLR|nr:MAG: Integrase [uncultured Chloroflexia bacterium]